MNETVGIAYFFAGEYMRCLDYFENALKSRKANAYDRGVARMSLLVQHNGVSFLT